MMDVELEELYKELREGEGKAKAIKTEYKKNVNRPMKRKGTRCREKPFICYDLETTRIDEGTPQVKYLTVYGENFKLSRKIEDLEHLGRVLAYETLTYHHNNFRFIAWNGNGFDVFFVAKSLLTTGKFILKPYLTKSKNLRGMRVEGIEDFEGLKFEFLDGMSMTGLDTVKMKLENFVKLMAPEYPKLDLDLEQVEFDPENEDHIAYAERDSEALYYAMVRANEIAKDLTGNVLQPTLGKLAITYFQKSMPEGVLVWKAPDELEEILQGPAKKGGYCWINKQYEGPVWKYDLNQAYAGAMRDCYLPCGSSIATDEYVEGKCGVYLASIYKTEGTKVPFYYRNVETNEAGFTSGKEVKTWLLSNEVEHLKNDGWFVDIEKGFYWEDYFSMKHMVDELERLRFTDPEGPKGALGTMVKTIGNSAYGKTLEQLEGIDLVMANECPDGYSYYMPEDDEMDNVFFKQGEAIKRDYHRPQIGCFITAHVRIQVREAALVDADHFLYADTDCVVFSRPVNHLDIDERRYGAWKQEADGLNYTLIGKKIYFGEDGEKHAKGLHVKELTEADFKAWKEGTPPKQIQIQRKNFVKFMAGEDMFGSLERRGTDVAASKQAELIDGQFYPL